MYVVPILTEASYPDWDLSWSPPARVDDSTARSLWQRGYRLSGWLCGWIDEWVDEWMGGWIVEWMDGWMPSHTKHCLVGFSRVSPFESISSGL